MLNKIKRFLLRQEGVKFLRKSDNSESLYFQIGDKIIRVSDHIPTSQCRPDELHVLPAANSESFIILVNNRVAIIPNYSKLKEYIKFYILTVGILGRTVYSVVTTERTVEVVKEVEKEVTIPVYKEVEGLDDAEKRLITCYRGLCPKHKQDLTKMSKELVNSKSSRKYRKESDIS